MTSFIHLPLKNTESADWSDSLRSFLGATFGTSFASEMGPSIKAFDNERRDVEHAQLSNEASLRQHLNYFSNLDSLDKRLPLAALLSFGSQHVEDEDDGNQHQGLVFTWSDAFDPTYTKSQKSVSFEKASVLFNISAIHSYLAAASTGAFDWKTAIDHFKRAAGTLQFIASKFLHAPTNDLDVDTVNAFSKVMIGQAQECFLLNYIQSHDTNVKFSLVARLSEGVSLTYRAAAELFAVGGSHKGKNKNLDCKDDMIVKCNYFHLFALVHQAKNYAESDQYGHALGSIKLIKDEIISTKKSIFKSNSVDESISQLVNELEEEIKGYESTWEKDNDLIYHEKIQPASNIPTIKAMDGANVVSLEAQLKENKNIDLFEKIVPMEAHESMSIYSEKQAEILRNWSGKVDFANEQIISTFEFLKLPQSVHEVQILISPQTESTQEEEREKENDYPKVLSMAQELEKYYNNSNSNDSIDFETYLSQSKRTKALVLQKIEEADSWIEKDEAILGANSPDLLKFKDEIFKVRKILVQAGSSDEKLKKLWLQSSKEVEILKGGVLSVQKWLSSIDQLIEQIDLLGLNDDTSLEIVKAKDYIDTIFSKQKSLKSLMDDRNNSLSDMKQKMHSEDISSILVNQKGASQSELENLFNKELEKYNAYTLRFSASIEAQEGLIVELKQHLNTLLDMNIIKKKIEERRREKGSTRQKISSLVKAYESWSVCINGVKESNSFYEQLGEKVSALLFKISNKVKQRDQLNQYQSSNHTGSFRGSVSSAGGFGGNTVNYYQQNLPTTATSIPNNYTGYSHSSSLGATTATGNYQSMNNQSFTGGIGAAAPPPIPSKPANDAPYSTPSVYNPGMYSQFSQNWKQ